MFFRRLAEYFQQLESTTLRNKMTEILADLFREAKKDEIGKLCYLLQGRVAPLYEAIEFGMADKMMIKAVAYGLNIESGMVGREFKKTGDLGTTTANLKSQTSNHKFTSQNLKINDVFDILYKIAISGGEGSQDQKIKLLGDLLKEVDPLSARYIVRITLCKMRLGFSDMTMLDALSWMLAGTKELRPEIERAYNVRPDLGFISQTIKEKGIEGLKHVEPKVGTPILMARAERMSSAKDIVDKIGKCAIEPKWDGFRCIAGYTPLYVKDKGYISVRDVEVGDLVLTYKGRFKKITAKNKRLVDKGERIYLFQSYLSDPIKISEGHQILVYSDNQTKWKAVEEVKVGDYLVFPRPQFTEFPREGLIKSRLQLTDESGYKKTIIANSDFYQLLGFWIGDGFTNEYHCTERVGLLFNAKTERELARYYKGMIASIFKISQISESKHNGALSIYWRDKPFRLWLSKYFRREWKGKMIPLWFTGLTKKSFMSFLNGWIESDGTLRHSEGYKIVTKERDLAALAQLISLHHGIPMGLHKVRAKIKKSHYTGTYYELILPGTDRYIKAIDNWMVVRVLKNQMIKRDPRMTLYNLQVEDDESYCSGLTVLHNCQIHKDMDEIKIFSRNLENTTAMYPDIVEGAKKQIKAKEAIFEGEAIAYNPKTGDYLPFQETVQRKRKYDISEMVKKVPLKLIAFDLLFIDGENLLNKPYLTRRKRLEKIISS